MYLQIQWKFFFLLALIHDVAIMVAAYAILQIPVNGTFIAALLTVGYSINFTIVILIKSEKIVRVSGRKIDYDNLVNVSVTQTLNRSINTSLTTLITISIFSWVFPKRCADIMIVGIISDVILQ